MKTTMAKAHMNNFTNLIISFHKQPRRTSFQFIAAVFVILLCLSIVITLPVYFLNKSDKTKSANAQTATVIGPGTNTLNAITTAGDYVLGTGTHTINTNTVLPAAVNLTASSGATLVFTNDANLKLRSNTTLNGLTISLSGNSQIALYANTTTDTYQQNITIKNCSLSGGSAIGIHIGQGFNSYNRNITIQHNTLDREVVFIEVASTVTISGNTFTNTAGVRPIEVSGNNYIIINNIISGGVTGIAFLHWNDLNGWMVPSQNNVIENNVISNITEEGISFDLYGDDGNRDSVREYDTVASAPGSNQVVLSSANWANQATYTGSYFHMSFITGALAGKYYLITTESGPAFTLNIPGSDYAQLRPGDGAVISSMASDNTIANNVVWNAKDGIVFWGRGYNDRVYNNIVTATVSNGYAIEFENLNGIDPTGSITGLDRRAPSDSNTASYNNVPVGITSTNRYFDYSLGVDPVFSPVNNHITNTTTGDPLLVNASSGDFRLTPPSPNIDAGTTVSGRSTDILGNPIYGTPDIGAYEYQPPYVMGTDAVNGTGNIRIYEDGKYRYTSATSGSPSVDFTATPVGGSFPTFNPTQTRPVWLDISSITWNTSGTYSKAWTASGSGAFAAVFNVGDLQPNQNYLVSVDGVEQTTAQADSNGRISYTYSGGWSTHTFNVDPIPLLRL